LTENIGLPRTAFRHVRARHPFTIEAAVILPDHLHAIWTLPEHGADFALRWRLFKSAFLHGLPRGEVLSTAEAPKANAAFGSGGIGSIRCVTKTTLPAILITFASTR
jgi:putative transposase